MTMKWVGFSFALNEGYKIPASDCTNTFNVFLIHLRIAEHHWNFDNSQFSSRLRLYDLLNSAKEIHPEMVVRSAEHRWERSSSTVITWCDPLIKEYPWCTFVEAQELVIIMRGISWCNGGVCIPTSSFSFSSSHPEALQSDQHWWGLHLTPLSVHVACGNYKSCSRTPSFS